MKKLIFTITATVLMAVGADAGEKFVATNYYVTKTNAMPIDEKSGFWIAKFEGISNVSSGPVDTMAVSCDGAGFWDINGVSGQGICVHGTDDDTFTLRWEALPGAVENQWEILSGKGKYLNLTGQGIAKTQKLSGNRRITTLEGIMVSAE